MNILIEGFANRETAVEYETLNNPQCMVVAEAHYEKAHNP